MRAFSLLLSVVLLAGWLWLMGSSLPGPTSNNMPPLGTFLSPFQGFLQQADAGPGEELQKTDMPGLVEGVQVHFDERMVPHIFAENLNDAYAALGYVHAQFRLFQMDLVSRSTAGRLAELLGPRLLARDRLQRRKGLLRSTEQTVESWSRSSNYSHLEAYSAGYNAYLSELKPRDYPIEFKLLNYEPEAWSPFRTALLLKSMALTLCSRNYDLAATNTRNAIGQERFDELYPDQMSIADPIIPATVEYPFIPQIGRAHV